MSSIIFRDQPLKINSIRSQSPMRKPFPVDFKKEDYQIPKNFLPPKKQKESSNASPKKDHKIVQYAKSMWKILLRGINLLLGFMCGLWELTPKIKKILEFFMCFLKRMLVCQKNILKRIFARKIFKKKALYIVILEVIVIYLLVTMNFKKDIASNSNENKKEGFNVNYFYLVYLIF